MKLRKWLFTATESDVNQSTNRPFREACSKSRGAEKIRSLIEKHNLPTQFIPGDSHARSLDDVLHFDIGHYPPKEKEIRQSGILYLNPKNGVFGQVSVRSLHTIKALIGYFIYGVSIKMMLKLVASHIALMDGLLVEGDSDLHTNSTKRAEYEALSHHLLHPSLNVLKEMLKLCKNVKTVTVFGQEMGRTLIDGSTFSSSLLRRTLDECGR